VTRPPGALGGEPNRADTVGDGLGYDVLSFDDASGDVRLVEVKTTGLPKAFPFYVTATEVRCSEDVSDRFLLYRVFDFASEPQPFVLPGSLRSTCRLDPVQYRAAVRSAGQGSLGAE
jgi:hypothetical protein